MPVISESAIRTHVRPPRSIARLLATGAAAAVALALMPAAAVATSATSAPSAVTTGDWTQFHHDLAHSGYNAAEGAISAANVAGLGVAWTATTPSFIYSSPAVADGVVYVGSRDGKLYAYAVGCASGGGTCTPLWTAAAGSSTDSSPAVSDGVVYIGAGSGKLYAFAVGCASGGGTCTPLWTATTSGSIYSSPAVANGVVYIGSDDGKLYAYAVGCASGGGTCTPLWTATTGAYIDSSPAVADGVVYVGSGDGNLYAYPVGCASGGGTCTPLWKATTGNAIDSAPTVSNGVVYVGSGDFKLYAFAVGCASGGGTCTPLWTATTGGYINASPAVANGVVYVGSHDRKLYAFSVGCASGGGTCTPKWTATTGGNIDSSPAVANGVVYVGSWDGKLYAYAIGCATGGGTCASLWTATTGGAIGSSPAVSNGVVYVGSYDHKLYAFSLPPATYHALTPTRILDTRNGTGLSGAFSSHVARKFLVIGQGGVLNNATAVTGNITVTAQTSGGYVFIGPNPMNDPTSSTLNFPVGDDRANAVTVALGNGGSLSVTYVGSAGPASTAHVIFDVTGFFTPDSSGSTYHPLNPGRILDTRNGTGLPGVFSSHVARTFQVTGHGGVPAGATAITGNLTVTAQTSGGYLFAGPIATNDPTSSTLNFPVGDDRANAVTVALGGGGTLSVTYVGSAGPSSSAHVIFDVTGFFTPDLTGARYVALNPARLLDTRSGTGLSGVFSSHGARTFAVSGQGGVFAGASAVTGNLTVTAQTSNGYLFIGPLAMNDPTSSTLNFPVGDDRANGVTVALGGLGTLSVTFVAPHPGPTTHVVFDVSGYFRP